MKYSILFLTLMSVNIYAQNIDCQELMKFLPDSSEGKNTFRAQTFMTSDMGKMQNTVEVDASKNIRIVMSSSMGLSMETEMILVDSIMYTKQKEDTIWTYQKMPQTVQQPVIPQFQDCKKVGSEMLNGRNFDIIEAKAVSKELIKQGFDSLQTMRVWVDMGRKVIRKMEGNMKNDKIQIKVTTEYCAVAKIEKPKNAIPDSLKPKPKRREYPKMAPIPFADYKKDSTGKKNANPADFAEYKYGMKALFEFIKTNLDYPKAAREAKKEGTVYLGFMVEADGTVSDIKVKRGIGYGCDEAAIEVIKKTAGNWQPVLSNGVAVKSPYTLPIKFKL